MKNLDISETFSSQTVILDHPPFADKDELFRFIASRLYADGRILSEKEFIEALQRREDTGSTYMGDLIAVPHGKSGTVQKNTIAFCRMKEPMQYRSFDEEGPVRMVFMLAVQDNTENKEYLRILATLSGLLVHEDFVTALERAKDYREVVSIFEEFLGN